jgi:hypothetical protein
LQTGGTGVGARCGGQMNCSTHMLFWKTYVPPTEVPSGQTFAISGTGRPAHGDGVDPPPGLEPPPATGSDGPGAGSATPLEALGAEEPPEAAPPPEELPEAVDGSGAMAPEHPPIAKPMARTKMEGPTICAHCMPARTSTRRATSSAARLAQFPAVCPAPE